MRYAALATIAALSLAAPAGANEGPVLTREQERAVARIIERAMADDTAFALVEGLTTEVGPRLGGTDAEARARTWAVRELKRLGFENVRVETFNMPAWSRGDESVSIVSPFPQNLVAAALGNSVATPQGGLVGDVVRFASLDALKAAPQQGLEGKIVFVDEKMARTQDGSGYGVAVAKRSGAANEAGRRGAAAAIIRSVGTGSRRNPHAGNMNYADGVARIPTAAISNPDADLLARAIARARGPVSLRIELATAVAPQAESGNVLAEIPGNSDEIIVIGGHLDSWDLGTGALDDGAGVAIAAAAARLVADVAGRPRRTLRVVYWGAEEVGLHGAKAYAAARSKVELDRHVLAGESDFGAGRVWRFETGFGETALAKATLIGRALKPLGVAPGGNAASGGADLGPLKAAGVPVIDLDQDGTDYFDFHHTPDDTLDKIDKEALRQNVAAWAVALYLLSELPGGFRDAAPPAAAN
jgi:hypothetical protein